MPTTYEQLASGLVVPHEPPAKPEPTDENGCPYCGSHWVCTISPRHFHGVECQLCQCRRWYPIDYKIREFTKWAIEQQSEQD